jgi:L-fucose isomerase-like protein
MQAPIFKRFYWWEDECTQRIAERFGVTIVKRSFKQLGQEARDIPDTEADAAWAQRDVHTTGLPQLAQRSAMKMYLAVRRHLDEDPDVRAAGINCLNESHFSDTTPCLAWNLLYEERKLIWGCEADTMSMLSKFILHHSLDAPILMTNLYPFLMGDAATKHEKIDAFPRVESEPENHVLVAHCGYMGVIPKSFSTRWTLKPKVLGIVDDNAHAIDADIATGAVTLAKLHASMDRMTVAQGELTGYAQFPDSDCLNGGVIRVRDGHKLMRSLASHHYLLMTGHQGPSIHMIADLFNLTIDEI